MTLSMIIIEAQHFRDWWRAIRQDRVTRLVVLPMLMFIAGGGLFFLINARNTADALRNEAIVLKEEFTKAQTEITHLRAQIKEFDDLKQEVSQLNADVTYDLTPKTEAAHKARTNLRGDIARIEKGMMELRVRMTRVERELLRLNSIP